MYSDLVGEEVFVVVTTKSDRVMEYEGTLTMEDDTSINMSDVIVRLQLTNMQSSLFGKNTSSFYDSRLSTVIINKDYVVSVIKK